MPKIDGYFPSPNYSIPGVYPRKLDFLVLHNTAGSALSAKNRFLNNRQCVSAHLIITRTGLVWQFVDFAKIAWHAGNRSINERSIGIELEAHATAKGITAAQELALVEWLRFLGVEFGLGASKYRLHRQIKPTQCPGYIWPTNEDFNGFVQRHRLNLPTTTNPNK